VAFALAWIGLCVVSWITIAEKGPSSLEPIVRNSSMVLDISTLSPAPANLGSGDPVKETPPAAEEGVGRMEGDREARSPGTWYDIKVEDFEAAFPGEWSCYATGPIDAYWDDAWSSGGARVHGGSWSGYCAYGGTDYVSPPGPYPANMQGAMVYGPFTLHDALDAELNFWHWTLTEGTFDKFAVYASVDGVNWYGTEWSGDQGGWQPYSFDLTNVYTLGNLCGERQVYVMFWFSSDESFEYEGTYLDDIVLQKSGKNWTVAVYMAADNSLGGAAALEDIDEMEKALVTSGNNVNVVVLYDDVALNDTMLVWVKPNGVEGDFEEYTQDDTYWNIPSGWAFTYPADCSAGYPTGNPGGTELNMGSGTNVTGFLDWVFRNFKSDQYALVLWNHGGGWEPKSTATPVTVDMTLENGATWERTFTPQKDAPPKKPEAERVVRQSPLERGICWDDTSGTFLETKAMATAIDDSSRPWVEILGFDACLMQMLEVAYEVRDTLTCAADYIVGSEETEWNSGWAYHQILAGITSTTTAFQLATTWGATREGRFASGGLDTISAIDVWYVDDLASAVSSLADRLTTLLATNAEYQHIMFAKLLSLCFAENEYLDLDDFCNLLSIFIWDSTAETLANAVRTQIANAVIATSNGSGYSNAGGISIYMPHVHDLLWGAPHINYTATNLAFCADGTWDEFLNAWLTTDYPDGFEPNNTPSTATDLGTRNPGILLLTPEEDFDDSTPDWYMFNIPYPSYLTVYAWCTEWDSDTVIYLYDSLANAQANTFFATNDDGLNLTLGLASLGSYYESPSKLNAGTYYVKVIPFDSAYAVDEDYELWVGTRRAPTPAQFRVEAGGAVLADGPFYGSAFLTGSADVAEWVTVSEPVEAGDVLELDPGNPGQYRKAVGPCSSLVAGVVSTEPGFALGSPTHYVLPTANAQALLALVGMVPVKACNENGPILAGDLVVVSSTPGYVMRWDGAGACSNLVGKAIESLDGPYGVIRILLTR
jgi:hypothetical protein